MKMQPITRVAARVATAAFVLAAITACGERISDTSARTPDPVKPSPSAVVIGQTPAAPTGTGTGTPVDGSTTAGPQSEMTKEVESKSMPLPGQPNDHSNLDPRDSKKAENESALKSVDAAKPASK